jgi:signal transduction histidine kinase
MSAPTSTTSGPDQPRTIPLRRKLQAGVGLLTILLVAGILAFSSRAQTKALRAEVEGKAHLVASQLALDIAEELQAEDRINLVRTRLNSLSQIQEYDYLAVVDTSQTVLALTHEGFLDPLLGTPELSGALREGQSRTLETTDPTGRRVYAYHFPVLTQSGRLLGGVLVGFDYDAVLAEVTALRRTVLLLGGAGLLAGAILTLLLARNITGPIVRLKEAAARIGSGDFGRTVEIETRDEIGALAATFNTMSVELKKREVEVRRSERLSAIGTTASVIAHEMKTPLQSVQTYSEMLKYKYDDPEYREKLTDVVIPQITRLGNLVDDLLDYSRETRLSTTEVDVNLQLHQAVSFFGETLLTQRVFAKEEYQADRTVEADPDKLEQVFFNLIKNAIEAQPEGGAIAVATMTVDGSVVAMVADTGDGIPEDAALNIFEPFFTTKSKGTGLGLAITQKIVQAHGGDIQLFTPLDQLEPNLHGILKTVLGDVWPGTGRGTCFAVRLPPFAEEQES